MIMRIMPVIAIGAVVVGLLGGASAPALAAPPGAPRAVAAKADPPPMTNKCRKQFKSGFRQKLLHDDWAHAYDYYEGRRKAEQAMYDQLRWMLADPQAQDLIPGLEAAAARDRAAYQPVIAKQRDENYKDLKQFERKFTASGCLTSARSRNIFKDAMRLLRASFQDIYKAHEKLFGVNLAIQTAQADLAGQYMSDADLEAATVEENMHNAWTQARRLY